MRLRGLLVLFAFGACASPSHSPVAPEPGEDVGASKTADTAALDAFFEKNFPPDRPEIAVLLAKHGRTIYARGYGMDGPHPVVSGK